MASKGVRKVRCCDGYLISAETHDRLPTCMQAVRGMRDLVGAEVVQRQASLAAFWSIAARYGYTPVSGGNMPGSKEVIQTLQCVPISWCAG